MMSATTAVSTIAPPINWPPVGASLKASQTQNGISGVSSVAINAACAAGKCREPSTKNVRPKATCRTPNAARMTMWSRRHARYVLRERQARRSSQEIRERRGGDQRRIAIAPRGDGHAGDRQHHQQSQQNPADVGTRRCAADTDRDAQHGDCARQHGAPARHFPEPDPGKHRRREWDGRHDDRHVGDAGQLQRRDKKEHRHRGEHREQQAAAMHPCQVRQARSALNEDEKHDGRRAGENAAPEQDREGVERQQPDKEWGCAPGDGGGRDQRDAKTMSGCCVRHHENSR